MRSHEKSASESGVKVTVKAASMPDASFCAGELAVMEK
jgi:hypothetical protein